MKLIDTVQAAAGQLAAAGVAFGHGTTNAFDEAAWLVLWRLGLPLDALDEHADRPLTAAERTAVDALVAERIATRKPAAYLTGEAWLQGVPFFADARAIVPRSLIAEPLAEMLFDAYLPDGQAGDARVLDLCTGNGSLAVLAALAWPHARVDAIELSATALALARRNVERHGVAERVRLIEGDGIERMDGRYDLILCNPPYVNARSMANLLRGKVPWYRDTRRGVFSTDLPVPEQALGLTAPQPDRETPGAEPNARPRFRFSIPFQAMRIGGACITAWPVPLRSACMASAAFGMRRRVHGDGWFRTLR